MFHNEFFKIDTGLVWMNEYYFFGLPSWEWFYPFHYAPMPEDLAIYLKSAQKETITFQIGQPLSAIQQLMAVLPIESARLCLPNVYIEKMESELKEFYVSKKETKGQNVKKRKKYRPSGKLLLPFLDQELLKEVERRITENNPQYMSFNQVGEEKTYCSKDFKR